MLKQILKNLFLFAKLNDTQLDKICALIKEKSYKKNSIIIREGEAGANVFFVVEGSVKITKISPEGREYTLKLIGAGDVFAEVILFTNLAYPANATALTNSRLASLAISDLETLISKDASLGIELIRVLSQRLYDTQNKIKQLAVHSVYERTLLLLLDLARSQGLDEQTNPSSFTLNVPLSRTELANIIGTTRETLTRMLGRLKQAGLIKIGENAIELNLSKIKQAQLIN